MKPNIEARLLGSGFFAGLMVFLAASFWGTAGVASRWIHEAGTANAIEIGFWRMALAVPLLLLIARYQGALSAALLRRAWPSLLMMGLCLAGFQVGYFAAIGVLGVAVATLLAICTIPVFTALLAWPWYGEAITPRVALALLTACIGAALIVSGASPPDLPGAGGLITGLPMALGASLCFALLTLAGRNLPAEHPPLWSATLTLGIAAVALSLLLIPQGLSLPANQGGTWPALLWIALLPTAVAYALFYAGVRAIASSTAGILILAEPLTANMLAWLLHNERLGLAGGLGALLLLTAMATMTTVHRPPTDT